MRYASCAENWGINYDDKNDSTGSWAGVLAPAGTPRPIIAKLHGELTRILQLTEVKERLAALDFELVGNTPESPIGAAARYLMSASVLRLPIPMR